MIPYPVEPITTYDVGVTVAISKKLADKMSWDVQEDPKIRGFVVNAFLAHARQIVHRQIADVYQVYPSWWQMLKASLPHWTFRFLGHPKHEDVVAVTEYHWICPHIDVPPTELAIHMPYAGGTAVPPNPLLADNG